MYPMATSAWLRKTASLAAGVALLLTSAALPILDQDMFLTGQRIEAEHSSSGCAYVHDHMVCVQLAGSRWIAATPDPTPAGAAVLRFEEVIPPRLQPVSIASLRPHSRAPPSA